MLQAVYVEIQDSRHAICIICDVCHVFQKHTRACTHMQVTRIYHVTFSYRNTCYNFHVHCMCVCSIKAWIDCHKLCPLALLSVDVFGFRAPVHRVARRRQATWPALPDQ